MFNFEQQSVTVWVAPGRGERDVDRIADSLAGQSRLIHPRDYVSRRSILREEFIRGCPPERGKFYVDFSNIRTAFNPP
jgi:hypothetical protein